MTPKRKILKNEERGRRRDGHLASEFSNFASLIDAIVAVASHARERRTLPRRGDYYSQGLTNTIYGYGELQHIISRVREGNAGQKLECCGWDRLLSPNR